MKRLHFNVKEERGVSSVLVLLTVLTFACILTGIVAIVMTRASGQMKSDMRIQEIYQNEVDRADEIYDEVIEKIDINTYHITYDLAGGTGVSNRTYTKNTETFTLPTPTRENYEFIGWTGSNGNVPQLDVTITKGTTGDKSYTANWAVSEYNIIGEVETVSTSGSLAVVKIKLYSPATNEDVGHTSVNGSQEKDYGYFKLTYGRNGTRWRIAANDGYTLYYSTSDTDDTNSYTLGNPLEWMYNTNVHYYLIVRNT